MAVCVLSEQRGQADSKEVLDRRDGLESAIWLQCHYRLGLAAEKAR